MRLLIPLLQRYCPRLPRKPMPPESRSKRMLNLLFGKYLLATNTVSSGLLMVVGDFVAQHIEREKLPAGQTERTAKVDWIRIGQMFLVGAVQGPVQHYFYTWLDRRFVVITPGTVAKKIFFDQTIMSPICIVTFFATASLVERQTFAQYREELSSKFWTVYISDWVVWPFAQYINFTFVPAPYRVTYVNALTLVYNVWLSIVKHNDLDLFEHVRGLYSAVDKEKQVAPHNGIDDPLVKEKPIK